MRRFVRACGMSLVCSVAIILLAETTAQPEEREIPLKDIWALHMPGTIDLAKIDNAVASREMASIRQLLSRPPAEGKDGKAGFVVLGRPMDALHEAHAVLVDGKKALDTIPKDNLSSVVFFSHEFGRYVHVQSVERRGNDIEIKYKFVPHKSKELTEHFALIPLGKLPAGTMRVNILQTPMPKELVVAGWKPISADTARRVVCNSFSFVVK